METPSYHQKFLRTKMIFSKTGLKNVFMFLRIIKFISPFHKKKSTARVTFYFVRYNIEFKSFSFPIYYMNPLVFYLYINLVLKLPWHKISKLNIPFTTLKKF